MKLIKIIKKSYRCAKEDSNKICIENSNIGGNNYAGYITYLSWTATFFIMYFYNGLKGNLR